MSILSVELTEENKRSVRVVSFDEKGKIDSISSKEPEQDNLLFAYFTMEDMIPFMQGTNKMSDYLVSKTKDVFTYEIIKNKVDIKKRSKESQLFQIPYMENVDIDITYDGKELKFTPSEDIVKGSGVTSSQQVTVGGKHAHVFFVTHDNKPEHLIQTLQIPFAELLSGPVSIKFEYNKYSISLYTQKFLETYSFRRL